MEPGAAEGFRQRGRVEETPEVGKEIIAGVGQGGSGTKRLGSLDVSAVERLAGQPNLPATDESRAGRELAGLEQRRQREGLDGGARRGQGARRDIQTVVGQQAA